MELLDALNAQTPKHIGNLSRHLGLKHGIRKENGTSDITETTFSNHSSIFRHNLMDPETANVCTLSLARMVADTKLPFVVVDNKAFPAYVRTLNKFAPILVEEQLCAKSRKILPSSAENSF